MDDMFKKIGDATRPRTEKQAARPSIIAKDIDMARGVLKVGYSYQDRQDVLTFLKGYYHAQKEALNIH